MGLTGTTNQNARTRVHVFGDFHVTVDDQKTPIGGKNSRRLLAVLALERGRTVPIDVLVDAIWGDTAPATAAHQVRKAATTLRNKLPHGTNTIITDGPGYRLNPEHCTCDATDFTTTVQMAQSALARRPEYAAELLHNAVTHYQPVVVGNSNTGVEHYPRALHNTYLTAAEHLAGVLLRLHKPDQAHHITQKIIREEPYAERFRTFHLQALAASGRTAEALREYANFRTFLNTELGVEPGPELQKIHHQLLTKDSSPSTQTVPKTTPNPELHWGADTLPAPPRGFKGRTTELTALTQASLDHERLLVITGLPGTGKTALALTTAHHVAEHFPDGQYFINLGAFRTSAEKPKTPAAALTELLETLGAASTTLPKTTPALIALWRKVTKHRSFLLIVDDVSTAADLTALIPSGSQSVTIATSRNQLPDADADADLVLNGVSTTDGLAILGRGAATQRVHAEPHTAEKIVHQTSGLPLALKLLNTKLCTTPTLSITELATLLEDHTTHLDHLSVGNRSITAALDVSLSALPQTSAKTLVALAQFPYPTGLSVGVAAAWLNTTESAVRELFNSFATGNWVQNHTGNTITFHDLVRSYLQHKATQWVTTHTDTTALDRVGTYLSVLGSYANHQKTALGTLPALPAAQRYPNPFSTPTASWHWQAEHWELMQALVTSAWAKQMPLTATHLVWQLMMYGQHNDSLFDLCAMAELNTQLADHTSDDRLRTMTRVQQIIHFHFAGRIEAAAEVFDASERAGLLPRPAPEVLLAYHVSRCLRAGSLVRGIADLTTWLADTKTPGTTNGYIAYLMLATFELERGHLTQAREHLQAAYWREADVAEKHLTRNQGVLRYVHAGLAVAEGNFEESATVLHSIYRGTRSSSAPLANARLYAAIALSEALRGDRETADEYYRRSVETAAAITTPPGGIRDYAALRDIDLALTDLERHRPEQALALMTHLRPQLRSDEPRLELAVLDIGAAAHAALADLHQRDQWLAAAARITARTDLTAARRQHTLTKFLADSYYQITGR